MSNVIIILMFVGLLSWGIPFMIGYDRTTAGHRRNRFLKTAKQNKWKFAHDVIMGNMETNSYHSDRYPLNLDRERGELNLDRTFTWTVCGKDKKYDMFKVVGLHPHNPEFDCVFVLGKDSHTQDPYIYRLPPEYMNDSLKDCIGWCLRTDRNTKLIEV